MLKQSLSIIGLIFLSVAIVLAMPYAQQGMQFLLTAHDTISQWLTEIFSGGDTGNLIRLAIALLVIPFVAALVPAVIFWFMKRRWLPGFMTMVWVIWLIQTAALVVIYKAA